MNFLTVKNVNLNFYYLNLFFWLFFNKFSNFNYKYFIIFYLYYLNILNLFIFLKNNNINFFLLDLNKLSNRMLLKYLNHIFYKKQIQLVFTNNKFYFNSNKILKIILEKDLFVYFLYLNFKIS